MNIETIRLNLLYLVFLVLINIPFSIVGFVHIYSLYGFFTLFPLLTLWVVVSGGLLYLLRKQYEGMDDLLLKMFLENNKLREEKNNKK